MKCSPLTTPITQPYLLGSRPRLEEHLLSLAGKTVSIG